jgi:hypothetical protein
MLQTKFVAKTQTPRIVVAVSELLSITERILGAIHELTILSFLVWAEGAQQTHSRTFLASFFSLATVCEAVERKIS